MQWLMRVLAAPPVREALLALAAALLAVTLAPDPQVVVLPRDVPVLDGQRLGLSAL